jgi:hypothetical protein
MTYYIGPQITPWQKQIILGTILGGSSIVKPRGGRNAYLSMRGKDAYWLEYKSHELKNLASPTPFLIENENKYFRWHSLCYPEFNNYHALFYDEKRKKIEMEVLNELRDIGLAIWYLDNAKLEKDKITFNTNVFKEQGTEVICRYFNEVNIAAEAVKISKSYRVHIIDDGIEKFLKTVAHRVPQFMLHKLMES